MFRRKRIIAALPLLVVAALAWLAYDRREPSYLGHPISYWIEPWHHHGSEPSEREAAAFAEMDERAVRWLARQLNWQPSKVKEGFAGFLNRFGDFMPGRDYDGGRRFAALRALTRLGARAQAAIPELEALSHTNVELNRDQMRIEAAATIVRIRGDSLEPYFTALKSASGEEWVRLAGILSLQETNAANAVPILVDRMTQTNRAVLVWPAVNALGSIRSHPELSLPALMQQLGKPDQVSEGVVFYAIARFGPAATNLWSDLAARWPTTSNTQDRSALQAALKSIDPVRFASTNWP